MGLPQVSHAQYSHKLTGLGKTVKYRAFTNAEQKILLLAKESKDQDRIIDAIHQILTNCLLSKVDIDKLSTFDLEDLFLRIRAKSVGEVIELSYRYDMKDDDGIVQSEFIKTSINIDDIKVIKDPKHSNIIKIDDVLTMELAYPTYASLKAMSSLPTELQEDFMIKACIQTIFNDEETWSFKDHTEEEKDKFLDSLNMDVLKAIETFFKTMPAIQHTVTLETKAGPKEVTFKGAADFFI